MDNKDWTPSWGCALLDLWKEHLPQTKLEQGTVIRQCVTLSGGGEKLRLEISNLYGKLPLEIETVHIASPKKGDNSNAAIDIDTDTVLTFGEKTSVAIPAGESVYCDPVVFNTDCKNKIIITIKLGANVPYEPMMYSSQVTGHGGARNTAYISTGADASDEAMDGAEVVEAWYYIANIDVLTDKERKAIVCFGDSITDGYGAITNMDTRWSDYLLNEINANEGIDYAVINRGIGGNAVATGGIGPNAINRFDRDVLGTDKTEFVIVFEGINDIGECSDAEEGKNRVQKVIEGFKAFIEKAHSNGIKIYGAILPPVGGHYYCTEEEEVCRNEINNWIKQHTNIAGEGYDQTKYDGVLDIETLLADPSDPTRLLEMYSTDGLHPNPKGYEQIGKYAYRCLFEKS